MCSSGVSSQHIAGTGFVPAPKVASIFLHFHILDCQTSIEYNCSCVINKMSSIQICVNFCFTEF